LNAFDYFPHSLRKKEKKLEMTRKLTIGAPTWNGLFLYPDGTAKVEYFNDRPYHLDYHSIHTGLLVRVATYCSFYSDPHAENDENAPEPSASTFVFSHIYEDDSYLSLFHEISDAGTTSFILVCYVKLLTYLSKTKLISWLPLLRKLSNLVLIFVLERNPYTAVCLHCPISFILLYYDIFSHTVAVHELEAEICKLYHDHQNNFVVLPWQARDVTENVNRISSYNNVCISSQ
jgi:hypothetical protein